MLGLCPEHVHEGGQLHVPAVEVTTRLARLAWRIARDARSPTAAWIILETALWVQRGWAALHAPLDGGRYRRLAGRQKTVRT